MSERSYINLKRAAWASAAGVACSVCSGNLALTAISGVAGCVFAIAASITPCFKNNLNSAVQNEFKRCEKFTCDSYSETLTIKLPPRAWSPEYMARLNFVKEYESIPGANTPKLQSVDFIKSSLGYNVVLKMPVYEERIVKTRKPPEFKPLERALCIVI